jgi:TonB family protein
MQGDSKGRVAGLAAMLLYVVALGAAPASGQAVTPLFDGVTLADWRMEGIDASAAAGVLTVSGGPGWVRHERVFANFRLTMDVRVIGRGARGGVYVRSWPTFDNDTNVPTNAYKVDLTNDPQGARSPDEVSPWQRVDIVCNGQKLTVRINDREVLTYYDLPNPQGFVALTVQGGVAEFRRLEISRLPRQSPQPPPGVSLPGGAVQPPRPVRNPKPQYTADAMRAKISGGATLDAVVLPDGTVGTVAVVQSLDPKHGLDQEAVKAVKQWRFEPGTLDGTPVPVLVSIEMTFSLR